MSETVQSLQLIIIQLVADSHLFSKAIVKIWVFCNTKLHMYFNTFAMMWWKWKRQSLSRVQLFATPWTVAHQAPLSMGFTRQEYWSGLPFPSPGDLPEPGVEPRSLALKANSLPSEHGAFKYKVRRTVKDLEWPCDRSPLTPTPGTAQNQGRPRRTCVEHRFIAESGRFNSNQGHTGRQSECMPEYLLFKVWSSSA